MSYPKDNYAKALERKKKRLRDMQVSNANRKAIIKFSDNCFSRGLCCRRVLKYVSTLAPLAEWLGEDFDKATRQNIEALVSKIERSDYSEWTKHDFKVALKKFYSWLRGCEDGYPPEVKWVRTTMRKTRTKLPEDILTQEEVMALVRAATNARDKALISTLYESGCRVGELVALRIKNVNQHPHGLKITVTGKKGPRRLFLITAVPHITAWLNEHPLNDNPQAPLWVTSDYRCQALSGERISEILKGAAKRASVKKAVNPHNFRHSRATHLANHLTEAQMNEYMGWAQGSDMPATYVHLSGRDVDKALLKLNNIKVDENDEPSNKFSPKKCLRCEMENSPSNRFCSRCGNILDKSVAQEMIKENTERNRADSIMDRLLEDEEVRDVLERKLKQLGM